MKRKSIIFSQWQGSDVTKVFTFSVDSNRGFFNSNTFSRGDVVEWYARKLGINFPR